MHSKYFFPTSDIVFMHKKIKLNVFHEKMLPSGKNNENVLNNHLN